MRDYTHFYRRELPKDTAWPCQWDIFISAFNDSHRVRTVFDLAQATSKHWILHNEYGYTDAEIEGLDIFRSDSTNEDEFILAFWDDRIGDVDLTSVTICIDSTGFLRPHLMFLLKLLVAKGAQKIDILYSEPNHYRKKDATRFSNEHVDEVRQVRGFEGIDESGNARDVLIIGAGYETHLIAEIAEDKDLAKKIVLLGFPSLRADMYQQNAWKTRQAADAIGETTEEKNFAPASDPFATATVLSEMVSREKADGPIKHLYLSPLATKAQAVGFVLFYLTECAGTSTSIIFPFTKTYERETSIGLSRIWQHTLEF